MEITIDWNRRLCKVNGEFGYFHIWEIGNCGPTWGIVEFQDRVAKVDPTIIVFDDEETEYLRTLNEHKKE